jgi:branched-chain amino acid transport system substrate-binding protein
MRKVGVVAVGVVLMLVASACGTRLPDSAFVAAGQPGTGTATGAQGAAARTAGATTTTVAGAAGAAAGGTTPGAGGATGAGGGAAVDPTAGTGGAAAAGADGPNQASDTGVTADEIVIGNITAQDGILGAAFRPPVLGLQAYVQWINDQGGVHGRKLRLETCNDREDRTRALQCAQDLVENKHVFAFVANNTRAEGGAAPYINQQGVPVFDEIPITNASYRYPHYWTIYGTACPRDGNTVCIADQIRNTSAPYRWFKENLGVKKAGVFYYGLIGESKQAGDFTLTGLKKEGYDAIAYDVNFASPNFDQAVQDMKNNGVDSIFDVIDDGANRKLCDTMQRYGFSVKAKVSTVVSYGDEVGNEFSDVCRNSIYIAGSTVSYDDLSVPAVKEFRDAYATYEPDAPLHQWALEGWMAGKALVDALGTMGPAPTRAGLEAWLSSMSQYTNGGLSNPIDYKPKDLQAATANGECLTVAQWQDSAKGWVSRTNPYQCYDGVPQYLTPVSERGD